MYLGTLNTYSTDLLALDGKLYQAGLDYTKYAAYYIGYMEGSDVDPVMWGDLKAKAEQTATMLSAWRKKYAQLKAVQGQADPAEWDRAAAALVEQGNALVTSFAALNDALSHRKLLSSILGNFAATVGILTKVVAIQIPAIAVARVKSAVTDTVTFAGQTLTTAGQAVGSAAGGIINPIKGTLWLVLGIAGLGLAAYLYTLAPKGKKA